jgi:hypothetical protein
MNHLLELALRTARKGLWNGRRFVVPDTFAARRFGLKPGRYFISQYRGVALTVFQTTIAGDLLLH